MNTTPIPATSSLTGIIIIAVIAIAVILAVLAIYLIYSYNKLVRFRNNRENAFANIDVQLQQRYDLVPQLVSTVKGYAAHEKSVLEDVTRARAASMTASSINDKIAAEQSLDRALANLKVAVEAYPELKANQNFLHLQTELGDIENKLAATRRYFNAATREYNNAVMVFPINMIAGMFGFAKEPMYEVDAQQRNAVNTAPQINF